jgi:hypothetical protein
MPTDRANKALESVGLGYLNIPKEAGYTFFFGKLPFKWSIENASFYVKDKVSITSIGERSLNKSIQGHLEFRTIIKESGVSEVFHLYLELPNTNYYYINYEGGVLSLLSSNPDFTTAISSLKKKELKVRIREDGKIIKVGGDDKEEDLAENGGKKPKKEKKPKKKKDDPEPTEEPTGDEPIEEPIEEPTEEPTGDEPAAPKVKLKENEIQIQLCEPMKMNFFIERMRSER